MSFAAALVLVDQVVKVLAVEWLSGRDPVRVVGSLLQFDLIRNPGAAFSFGTGNTVIFTVISTVVSCAIVVAIKRCTDRAWGMTFGALLAGALGNLIDRLVRWPGFPEGHVIDMFRLPNFPVFNVADMCITFAVVSMLILSLRGREPWPQKREVVA